MALPATDTFTFAGTTPLPTYNASWTNITNRFDVSNNAVIAWLGNNTPGAARWNADVFNDNQYSTGTIIAIATSNHLGVSIRCSTSSAQTWYGYEGNSVDSYLYKVVAGVLTILGSAMVAFAVNDLIRIEANGTSLECKKNSVSVMTQTDSAISSGSAGICGEDNGASNRLDNWEGGNLSTGPATSFLPFQRPMLHMIVR